MYRGHRKITGLNTITLKYEILKSVENILKTLWANIKKKST